MFVLSLAIAGARHRFVQQLQRSAADVRRWGGWLLIVIGLWLIALAAFPEFFAEVFPV